LHVHDEVITLEDIDDARHSVERLESVLCDLPEWARGMPMAAEGYENPFYMKD
jgi:DNA polymerase